MKIKLKKILIKIPFKVLIIYFILSSAVIILDKIPYDFSFLNNFESEWVVNLIAGIKDLRIFYYNIKWIFYLLFFLDIIIIAFKIILKNDSIKIMIVNTFENTKVNISTKYMYENKDFYKDLSNDVKILGDNYLSYAGIVKELDKYVENFMEKKEEKYYAFAGILHTPYILRLGYKVGDQTYFKLFHKKRDEEIFKLLIDKEEYSGNYPELKVEKSLKESNTLIVSISTTFPITEEQLNRFNIESNNYLKFETIDKGFDIITSEKQIDYYKDIIFSNIREIVRIKKIKQIHLCISSSVAFTFALGQGFSKNYDPNVIIYNYENQQYTWGLNLFEKAENSIVKPEEKIIK